MVSLKKTQIREVTPVHLMDEEEAVRTYCPPKTETTSTVEILINKPDKKELPAVKHNAIPEVEKAVKSGAMSISNVLGIRV